MHMSSGFSSSRSSSLATLLALWSWAGKRGCWQLLAFSCSKSPSLVSYSPFPMAMGPKEGNCLLVVVPCCLTPGASIPVPAFWIALWFFFGFFCCCCCCWRWCFSFFLFVWLFCFVFVFLRQGFSIALEPVLELPSTGITGVHHQRQASFTFSK